MKKNLIQALKKLLVAFGGAKNTSEITDTNIVPIVDKLADAVSEFSPSGGDENIRYLIEPQTVTTTGNEEFTQIIGLLPSKIYNGEVEGEEVINYFNNNIIVKINNQKVSLDADLGGYILEDGEMLYQLTLPFGQDGETAIWGTVAVSFDGENMTPVATEYAIEVYEIIENQTINLPIPSAENVGQVLTSVETETNTYAFGFTTPTSSFNDTFIINVNPYATTLTNNNQMGITFNETFEEISAAFTAGKRIYAKIHNTYYNPSFIYQGTTLISIHIRWYQQMLEANRQNKHIIFYEINGDNTAITSYIYKINATIYEDEEPTLV